jgi:hypothetical protein
MRPLVIGLIAVGLMATAAVQLKPAQPVFDTQLAWADRGEWIRGDTHLHTRFSDGAHSPEEIAAQAVTHGCQAIAFTDHADRTLGGASPEYFAAIESVRAARSGLVVVAGLEWNVPPSGGDDHAAVLLPQVPDEGTILAEFKRRFDDFDRDDERRPRIEDALAWLATTAPPAVKPVVIYNHPSRKDSSSLQNADEILRWRAVNDLAIGFESGPGHQGRPPFGSYSGKVPLIDRWDPVAAQPGDAWDTLLQRGVDVHGAMASSDFHNANPGDLNDFWPCQFAETSYYVPERTPAGLLRALRAGAFYAVHGHIARRVELRLNAVGLPRPAVVGERLRAPLGSVLTASLNLRIPEADWNGAVNRVDVVEFILVTPGGVLVHPHAVSGTGDQRVDQPVTLDAPSLVIRARGRRIVPDGPDLMFYTNAIRVSAF